MSRNNLQLHQRVKSQRVRLLDVFLYGPFIMIAALSPKPNSVIRASLFLLGIGTIIYNANNYMKVKKGFTSSDKF